ncbi:MAG: pyruvate carboxylase [Trebouxia sp. A1-2]|nr:MAG: pyruvate carboxylase [Trebouxia sp. A1-2]
MRSAFTPEPKSATLLWPRHGNCFFGLQSLSLGLGEQWEKVKTAYAQANRALGDIVKVNPETTTQHVEDLLQGNLGQPAGGFPEPLTSRVIKDKKNIAGRPGAGLSPVNLRQQEIDLKDKHDKSSITYRDVMSSAMYPQVFDEFKNWQGKYSKYTEAIPTRAFLTPLDEDEEVEVDISKGNITHIKYRAMGELQPNGTREVFFDTNGVPRTVEIVDTTDQGEGGSPIRKAAREKALPDVLGSVGAPMAGEVMQGCQVTQDISNIHGLWTVQCT